MPRGSFDQEARREDAVVEAELERSRIDRINLFLHNRCADCPGLLQCNPSVERLEKCEGRR